MFFVPGTAAIAALLGLTPLQPATASFTFTKGYAKSPLLGGSQQTFAAQSVVGDCRGMKRILGLNWSSGKVATKRMPAGARLNLFAQTSISHNGVGLMDVNEKVCAASVTFTPLPGGRYDVIQPANPGDACTLLVTDAATGAPPPDLVRNDVPICKIYTSS